MEAADDAASGVTPLGGLIVGREDDFAGAAGRAEQRGLGHRQQIQIAEGGEMGSGIWAKPLAQAWIIFHRNRFNWLNIRSHRKIRFATLTKTPFTVFDAAGNGSRNSCTLVCSESKPRARRGVSFF